VNTYVSTELTHFVGATKPSDEERFALLLQIVRQGRLVNGKALQRQVMKPITWFEIDASAQRENFYPEPYFATNLQATLASNEVVEPDMVCFCDIPYEPVAHFRIHTAKYNRFGIAFSKDFLISHGASPVFYIARTARTTLRLVGHGDHADFFRDESYPSLLGSARNRGEFYDELRHRLLDLVESQANLVQEMLETYNKGASDPQLHRLALYRAIDLPVALFTYFFGYTKFFDPTLPEDDPCNFYMEREWRLLGEVKFTIGNIARVLLPSEFIECFRIEAPEYDGPILELPDPSAP